MYELLWLQSCNFQTVTPMLKTSERKKNNGQELNKGTQGMQNKFKLASVQRFGFLLLLCYKYEPEFKCFSLKYVMNVSTIYGNLCTGSNIYLKI